jgi:Ca-activated chloride channel homolog
MVDMRPRVSLFSAALLFASGLAGTAIPQPASSKTLFVTVMDRDKQLVRDLTQEDFTVNEDGKPRPITVFDANPPALSVVVLIDTSASMEDRVDQVGKAAGEFVSRLSNRDVAAVGSFHGRATFVPATGFSSDGDLLRGGLQKLTAAGSTSLYNALGQAIERLSDAPGHRVIVAFSDGNDTSSLLTGVEIRDRARAANVTLHALTIKGPGREPISDYDFKDLVSDSGGQVVMLNRVSEWAPAFARVADELHAQYVVGFSPTAGGTPRKIEVKVSRKGLTVRTRKYYAVDAPAR